MSRYPRFDTKLFTEIWERADEFVDDYQRNGLPTTISTANAQNLYYLLYAKYGNNPIANYDEEQFKYKVFSIIWQYGPTWQKRLSVQETLRAMQLADLVNDGAFDEAFSESGSNNSTVTGTNGNTRTLNTNEASTGTQAVAHTGTVRTQGDSEDIKNHAFNPGTAPAQDAYSPLTYINEQQATKNDVDNTTTYNNTDTTTNNLNRADTGTITDAGTSASQTYAQNAGSNELHRTITKGKLAAYEKLLELLDSDVTGEFLSKFKVCFKQFVMPEHTWIYVTDLDEEEEEEEE